MAQTAEVVDDRDLRVELYAAFENFFGLLLYLLRRVNKWIHLHINYTYFYPYQIHLT